MKSLYKAMFVVLLFAFGAVGCATAGSVFPNLPGKKAEIKLLQTMILPSEIGGKHFIPECIAVDENNVYSTTTSGPFGQGELIVFDKESGKSRIIDYSGRPVCVAADGNNIYIADTSAGGILVFDKRMKGNFTFEYTVPYDSNVLRMIVHDDVLYVINKNSGIISAFSIQSKKLIFEIGGAEHLNSPRGLAINSAGDFFIAGADEVQVFDRDGKRKRRWSWENVGTVPIMKKPDAGEIAIDKKGKVYVSYPSGCAVRVFSENGNFLYDVGECYKWSFLHNPGNIIISGDRMYVASSKYSKMGKEEVGSIEVFQLLP